MRRSAATSRPRVLTWESSGRHAGRETPATIRPGKEAKAGLLFPSGAGGAYTNFPSVHGNLMRRLAEEAAKGGREFRRFRVHNLRHRFAINWLKSGGDIYRLSRHPGHKSVKTAEVSLNCRTDDEIDVFRGVSAQRRRTTKPQQSKMIHNIVCYQHLAGMPGEGHFRPLERT